jgi:hypothetical protein
MVGSVDPKTLAWARKISKAPSAGSPSPSPPGGGAPGQPDPLSNPALQAQITALASTLLRETASRKIYEAANTYEKAIVTVRGQVTADEAAEDAKLELELTIVLSVALLAAGPAIGALGGAAAKGCDIIAPKLTMQALDIATRVGVDTAKSADIGIKALDWLKTNFDQKKATDAINNALSWMKGKAVKVKMGTDERENVHRYLDSLKDQTEATRVELQKWAESSSSSFEELSAYVAAFENVTEGFYVVQVTQQLTDFKRELLTAITQQQKGHGDIMPRGDKFDPRIETTQKIYKLNAYGGPRYARIDVLKQTNFGGSGETTIYSFGCWITPNMEPMAKEKCVGELDPSQLSGHLPAPDREPVGERVVRIDCWGKPRLAIVHIGDDSGFFHAPTNFEQITFTRWVSDEDAPAQEARGGMQNGGVNNVSPTDVKGLKQPPDVPAS